MNAARKQAHAPGQCFSGGPYYCAACSARYVNISRDGFERHLAAKIERTSVGCLDRWHRDSLDRWMRTNAQVQGESQWGNEIRGESQSQENVRRFSGRTSTLPGNASAAQQEQATLLRLKRRRKGFGSRPAAKPESPSLPATPKPPESP